MLTSRDAARLLAAPLDATSLAPLAAALGFEAPAPLPRDVRDALGVPPCFARAHLARGAGTLRALLVEHRGNEPFRDALRRLAARLAEASPQLLWLVLAVDPARHEVAIATWDASHRPPKLVALVVQREHIVESDAQTLAALAALHAPARGTASVPDELTHSRWMEVLGREALTGRFYRALEETMRRLAASLGSRVPDDARHALALLCLSRLLFLSFLETKGWLDGDRAFLSRHFDDAMHRGGDFHRRVLLPLWFGTLNTTPSRRAAQARALGRIPFLNGGLFGRAPIEARWRRETFSDEALGAALTDLLQRYRFTAREDSATWSEAAVDPEMLGLAFESLMAARERKTTGAFYTPPLLVTHLTHDALARTLVGGRVTSAHVEQALRGERVSGRAATEMLTRIDAATVLDPACGSGAFLVHALEALATARRACGDARPVHTIRRDVLARSIHGVDVNPMAVWLCELRLWLCVVIEHEEPDPRRVPPLPNLDRNIRVGDALSGGDFGDAPSGLGDLGIGALRLRYARATGHRKRTLAATLDREERRRALAELDRALVGAIHARRESVCAARQRDLFGDRKPPGAAARAVLRTLRSDVRRLQDRRRAVSTGAALPFSYATHFATIAAQGGFALVIGNPPWVRLHHIAPAQRAEWRRRYAVHRGAAWVAGAERAGAATGFAAQVDVAALFTERAIALTKAQGHTALILPAKLWRSLAGGGVRSLIGARTQVVRIEDWTDAPSTFDAAVYPSLLVLRVRARESETPSAPATVVVRTRHAAPTWESPPAALAFDETVGSPWLLLPPLVREAFDALRAAGRPLADTPFGRPLLGVKSGCNEAYVVQAPRSVGPVAQVRSGERRGAAESAWLRPLVRGERVAAWRIPPSDEAMVWPHNEQGPLPALPPAIAHWLAPHRRALIARADARGARTMPWWSLFRTEGARSDCARVVWSDFGRAPRAAVLPEGNRSVPLNTCYVARAASLEDAYALAALLNSAVAAAWLGALAEPARGGWKRYLGWTVALLPVPHDWAHARTRLAPLAQAGYNGEPPTTEVLWRVVADVYGVAPSLLRPLLEWNAR